MNTQSTPPDAPQRDALTRQAFVEHEEIWALQTTDGLVSMQKPDDTRVLPLWPSEVDAKAHASDEWANAQPVAFSAEAFFYDLMPMLVESEMALCIFPDVGYQDVQYREPIEFAIAVNAQFPDDAQFELPY